ncbi:hypothetical protein HHI36_014620, partial [Cryptolaemus montrouzieri]
TKKVDDEINEERKIVSRDKLVFLRKKPQCKIAKAIRNISDSSEDVKEPILCDKSDERENKKEGSFVGCGKNRACRKLASVFRVPAVGA